MEKLLATSDYRKHNTAEKALKLYNVENLSKTKAENIQIRHDIQSAGRGKQLMKIEKLEEMGGHLL